MSKLTPEPMTRRMYLTMQSLLSPTTSVWEAIEAVASTALAHPEWDMEEEKTWDEWEMEGVRQ